MKYYNIFSLVFVFVLSVNRLYADDKNISIGLFSSGDISSWESKSFSGITHYQITEIDNTFSLQAKSHASASGLFIEQRIDLNKTPYLNWSWRINQHLNNLNEQSKSGDDFSARIYIVVSGGWAFWRTKAINYVWAGNTAKGFIWPNAFVGKKSMMVALRSHDDKTQVWYQEKRNIQMDFKQIFGSDIQYIDGIALMTDTDNSQSHALAYYGDIYFSAE